MNLDKYVLNEFYGEPCENFQAKLIVQHRGETEIEGQKFGISLLVGLTVTGQPLVTHTDTEGYAVPELWEGTVVFIPSKKYKMKPRFGGTLNDLVQNSYFDQTDEAMWEVIFEKE